MTECTDTPQERAIDSAINAILGSVAPHAKATVAEILREIVSLSRSERFPMERAALERILDITQHEPLGNLGNAIAGIARTALKIAAPQSSSNLPAQCREGRADISAETGVKDRSPNASGAAESAFSSRCVAVPQPAFDALKAAAEKFCRRRDAGELRSNQSYADFKAALDLLPQSERHGE